MAEPSEKPARKPAQFSPRSIFLIALAVAAPSLAFAYTAGWLYPQKLTPEMIIDALSRRGGDPIGHRRNHAKGICFTGHFEANGTGTGLTTAAMFAAGSYPVTGRFAIAVGNPEAADSAGRVKSMAIRILGPDGEEWRSAMNSSPVFAVSNAQGFYELTAAYDIDPATGKPDPQALQRYMAAHPESMPFFNWVRTAPWTKTFADQTYSSLNAFVFVDPAGEKHPVRWAMQPTTAQEPVPVQDIAKLPADFLEQDLKTRLASGPLRWHLVATLAQPGDPTNDATKVWPDERRHVDVGDLIVEAAEDEADGPCRDINYDPLILPEGIKPSDDPLLPARSSVYAHSFDLRAAEARHYSRLPEKKTEPTP